MPTSPFVFHSGIAIVLAIVFISITASVFSFISASISLSLYRKTLAKRMAEHIGASSAVFPDIPPHPAKTNENKIPGDLYASIGRQSVLLIYQYAIAAVCFALVAASAAFYALSISQISVLQAARHPLQWLFLFWTFLWPGVLTFNVITLGGPGKKCSLVAFYFLGLILLAGSLSGLATEVHFSGAFNIPAFSGETPVRMITKWLLFNAAPTLLHVVFQAHFVRAVAPLLLAFMVTVSTGLLGLVVATYQYPDATVMIFVNWANTLGIQVAPALALYSFGLLFLSFSGCGLFGWLLMAKIRDDYLSHKISDQSLAIDALWLLFSAFYAVILALAGIGWAGLALLAFGVYKFTSHLASLFFFPLAEKSGNTTTLLVLRVFSLGKRSERLFGKIAKHWRYVGHIQFITSTDVALTTIAPHRFLAFISGKLNRCFIKDNDTLQSSLAGIESRPDRDGRYRINDYFCYADTWQSVLARLVANSSVVFMDLRNFSDQNNGCVYEIAELLANVPLSKLVFAIDGTTNTTFLSSTMAANFAKLTSDSPNFGLTESMINYVRLSSSRYPETDYFIRTICLAAETNA